MAEPASVPVTWSFRSAVARWLAVAAFVAGGFVAIWQGFGAAGYGTDAHRHRVLWTCFQLLGLGAMAVFLRGWLAARVLLALVAFGSASLAWWTVQSSDVKSLSLREAVAARDRLSSALKTATPDDIDRHNRFREIDALCDQYPTLTAGLKAEYDEWKARHESEVAPPRQP